MDWAKTTARWDDKHLSFGIWCAYIIGLTVCFMIADIMLYATWCDMLLVALNVDLLHGAYYNSFKFVDDQDLL